MNLPFNIVHSEGNVRHSDIQSPYVEKDATCIELLIEFILYFNFLLDSSENNSSQYANKCSRLFNTRNCVIKVFQPRRGLKGAQGEYR
jgi:hypothetical protein